MLLQVLAAIGGVTILLFLLFVVFLFRADSDLVLFSKTLRESYFKDRVVWVTGASSGIGEAIVRHLDRLGAKVILSSRSQERLNSVQESLANPSNAKVLRFDLSDAESLGDVVKDAVSLFGHVDILINNAGVSQRGLFDDFTEETNRRLMEVDFFGQITLTKALLPEFVQHGFGHIANVSSIAGKYGFPGRTIYSAAKFALMGYMDSLRMELFGLDRKIFVTNICPGPVATNADRNALRGDGTLHEQVDEFTATGMKPERCAELSLIAISNQLDEAWTTSNPLLLSVYMHQYLPFIANWLLRRQAKGMVEGVRQKTRKKAD